MFCLFHGFKVSCYSQVPNRQRICLLITFFKQVFHFYFRKKSTSIALTIVSKRKNVFKIKFKSTRFFHKQHFYKKLQAEIGKKSSKAKQHPDAELLLFEN